MLEQDNEQDFRLMGLIACEHGFEGVHNTTQTGQTIARGFLFIQMTCKNCGRKHWRAFYGTERLQ
jgi:hypothetical protein